MDGHEACSQDMHAAYCKPSMGALSDVMAGLETVTQERDRLATENAVLRAALERLPTATERALWILAHVGGWSTPRQVDWEAIQCDAARAFETLRAYTDETRAALAAPDTARDSTNA